MMTFCLSEPIPIRDRGWPVEREPPKGVVRRQAVCLHRLHVQPGRHRRTALPSVRAQRKRLLLRPLTARVNDAGKIQNMWKPLKLKLQRSSVISNFCLQQTDNYWFGSISFMLVLSRLLPHSYQTHLDSPKQLFIIKFHSIQSDPLISVLNTQVMTWFLRLNKEIWIHLQNYCLFTG